jgi:hypothetical protein
MRESSRVDESIVRSLSARSLSRSHDAEPDRNVVRLTAFVQFIGVAMDHSAGARRLQRSTLNSTRYFEVWSLQGFTIVPHMLRQFIMLSAARRRRDR